MREWRIKFLERKNKERLQLKLDLSEIINYTYVGSQPAPKGKQNEGARQLRRWREKLLRELYPEYYDNRPTFWDMMRARGKSLKVN